MIAKKKAPSKRAVPPKALRKKVPTKRAPPKSNKGPTLDLPGGSSEEIPPQRLLLDPQNLRLFDTVASKIQQTKAPFIGQPSVQNAVFDLMLQNDRFDIMSLVSSIENNGFLRHERLIVAKYDGSTFLVLEGNRRLTAVRSILKDLQSGEIHLSPHVKQSIGTLPCFVVEGELIGGNESVLEHYRRSTEIYIGMRHLLGAKSWDPASRYEFQARLILKEGWTPEQVADRFGRKKSQIQIELKAQRLYNNFMNFERQHKLTHTLTYNAFAEAARAAGLMKWLEWSDAEMDVKNKSRENSFFHYLINRIRKSNRNDQEDSEVDSSAESAVRKLRDLIKLEDDDILEALEEREFEEADLLFESRKEGEFPKRLASYLRLLKNASVTELMQHQKKNAELLAEVIKASEALLEIVKVRGKR